MFFFRGREAESYGCFAGEASCQTQRFTAVAGDLQSCASGHGESETYFSEGEREKMISISLNQWPVSVLKMAWSSVEPVDVELVVLRQTKQTGFPSDAVVRPELTWQGEI